MNITGYRTTSVPTAVTDGTQDYSLVVAQQMNNYPAYVTVSDTTPDASTSWMKLSGGQGISSITHPGKVWIMSGPTNTSTLINVTK